MHEQIIDALRRGAADEALAAARQAVAAEPHDPTAQRLLASALRMTGDIAGAMTVVDQALALSPEDAGLHMERGSLLLTDRGQLDEAQAALARSVGLDPNQFPAYILQAQLALGRGDLDEAHRLARTASRLAPEHPQILGIDGMVALYRGEHDRALKLLTLATQRAPTDPSLKPALGFAYLANGHLAFAEQTFRSLLERAPGSVSLVTMIADLVRRQGRPAEAADSLAPLAQADDGSPGLRRAWARLELEAGRPERALPALSAAFERNPDDLPALEALVDLWRVSGQAEQAREAIDRALAARPQSLPLWRARLLFEPYAGAGALGVVERWMEAMPDHIPALEARATIHDAAGETEQADEIAFQIAALQPGRSSAELRIVDSLLRRDPKAAVARVEGLIAQATDPAYKAGMRQLLGRTQAAAGDPAAAVATWSALQAELIPQRLPLPAVTAGPATLPDFVPAADGTPGVLFLWGPPGSMVETLGATLSAGEVPLLLDRNSPRPPRDPLQRYGTSQELVDGRLDPSFLVSQWRAALPSRGHTGGPVFDWLLWWDNALVPALRAHLGEALLMVGIRDPRDMLLDWLAWGPVNSPFALESPLAGARWMARSLEQLSELHDKDLFPHTIVPLDTIAHDPQGLVSVINRALGLNLPPPPRNALGPNRNQPGAWRAFTGPLAEAFALLTPQAVKFGYPEQ
ncbi:tetratricopeptide repeat protein [Agrilutibacter solisilvae]|uniref:Tetratricopeptide repeat protein n=1 Tax=Agrilutibacter solisilvae TaxID=2763317 RepID=A0A974Y2A5_9GAMM|nr:tetratricopeptide repeat protein [Lysobacter solisilvae]QSX79095.1 tetratricopeptide repeat protein [Lysobacter solisilvae]